MKAAKNLSSNIKHAPLMKAIPFILCRRETSYDGDLAYPYACSYLVGIMKIDI
jgi:hypothetical protein